MSAYVIAQIQINDPDRYQEYLAGFMPIFERHEGRMLTVSSKEIEIVEGTWALGRAVLMQFPSLDHAHGWLDDPEYLTLAKHRHASAEANIILVDGLD